MIRFVNMALQELASHPDARVKTLVVEVGELTGVLPEYLLKYYPAAVRGTRLEGSDLEVISIPAQARCADCGGLYHPCRETDYRCPACTSANARFVHGRELNLRELRL